MSIMNALEFIRRSGKEDIMEKLSSINTANKEDALKTIVEIGHESGFDFTPEEYEEAAQEVTMLLEEKGKSISDLQTSGASAANCNCTGCATCAACTTCLVCISCAWCVVIPVGGEAVIAADAAGVISAATSLATSVTTAVASSVQSN